MIIVCVQGTVCSSSKDLKYINVFNLHSPLIVRAWRGLPLFVKRKGLEIELSVVRWMDLESVMQSEVSQKEKNKYRMLTHIYGI